MEQKPTTETLETTLQATIMEIKEAYAALEQGDPIASKIGLLLLEIKDKKLFKHDKGKDGKGRASMADFIKAHFDFTPQYASMLMRSVEVKQTLKLGDDVPLRSLRALNPYAKNEDSLRGIWALATQSNSTPNANDIAKAIEAWKSEHPEEAGETRKKTDKQILKQIERAMEGIATLLEELSTKELKREMVKKAMELFGSGTSADEATADAD